MEIGVLVDHFGTGVRQLEPQLGICEAVDDLDKTDNMTYSAARTIGPVTELLHEQKLDLLVEVGSKQIAETWRSSFSILTSEFEDRNQSMHVTQLNLTSVWKSNATRNFLLLRLPLLRLPAASTHQQEVSQTLDDAWARLGARHLQHDATVARTRGAGHGAFARRRS